jgi:protein O-mannosyl-transferase
MASKRAPKKHAGNAPAKLAVAQNQLSEGKLEKFYPAFIVFAGIIAYYNSLRAPFIFDDRYHIVENARIRELWPLGQLLFHTSRPVVILSLALNYALGGLNPVGYHIFNLGVHILAALALYGIVRRTLVLRTQPWRAAAPWLAVAIASIWMVHPIQTESVTYTIQRGESLTGLFYLFTLYCVIRVTESPKAIWKGAAVASCLLGMGTKGGVMLTGPVLILLYDRIFVSRSWSEVARQRWGLYASLAATWLAYPLMLAAAPEEWKESAGFGYAGASPLQYAMTQPKVVLHYLRLSLWPDQLCLDYGWPVARGTGEILPFLIILGGIAAATLIVWRKRPALAFLGAWFFIVLMPTSSFVPIADVAVEHRMYLPLAAVIALIVTGLFLLATPRSSRSLLTKGTDRSVSAVHLVARGSHVAVDRVVSPLHQQTPSGFGWIIAGLIVVVLTVVTIERNADYASKLSIWADTVAKSPHNPRAQYDLGVALEETDNFPEALAHYRLAVQENPKYADALTNLGHLLLTTGRVGDSVPYLEKAIELKPDLAEAHNSLALALVQQGKVQEAVAHWEQALRIKPGYAEPHNNLAIVLAQEGKIDDAVAHWEKAIKLDSNSADAHNNLAYTLSNMGRNREAKELYEQALRIKPNYFQAQINLAKLLVTLDRQQGGDPDRAVALAQQACGSVGHRDAVCLGTLAGCYAAASHWDEAVRTSQDAIELARSSNETEVVKRLEAELELYRRRSVRR